MIYIFTIYKYLKRAQYSKEYHKIYKGFWVNVYRQSFLIQTLLKLLYEIVYFGIWPTYSILKNRLQYFEKKIRYLQLKFWTAH